MKKLILALAHIRVRRKSRRETKVDLQDQIELLCRLGLSPNQAKVYLVLARSSHYTANQVSKAACLATEVVYRNMTKLQEKGLVEKEITSPTKFQAIPLKSAMRLLLNLKSKEDTQTRMKARELLATSITEEDVKPAQEDFRTVLIPEGERLIEFEEEQLTNVQQKFDLAMTGQQFSEWALAYTKLLQKMVLKKIAIRLIVSGTKTEHNTQSLDELLQNTNFKMKFTPETILSCVGIQDDKEVMISTSTKTAFARSPVYWSNNPGIVVLCKTYFETTWKNNMEKRKQYLNKRTILLEA